MNIGDRVRLMHSKDEGIITRFLENNLVEVAIDNDFTIPVTRREIVLIAPEENKAFGSGPEAAESASGGTQRESAPVAPALLSSSGIFVALSHQTEDLLAVNILNNSDYDVLFTCGEERQARYRGIHNDKLGARKAKVVSHLHLKDFDQWPDLVVQFLQHRSGSPTMFEPVVKRVHFKASSFYKSKKMAPVIKQEAYLFQLDTKAVALNPDKILEQLAEPESKSENYILQPPPHEVDLHIEKLISPNQDLAHMSNSEILRLQLATFQDHLDRALAANMHEIVFIHGVGNGVLRKEIHKLLSRSKEIKYYEEARKEKFGYGATLVKLK